MRCKKHLCDLSSTVGVCATCLREKLIPLLAVQSPPLIFPRSVSPPRVHNSSDHHPNRLFFSTPQLRPTIPRIDPFTRTDKKSKFSLFPKFMRSSSTTTSSSSWISNLFKKSPSQAAGTSETVEAPAACRRAFTGRGRGMSPARVSDCGADEEFDGGESSGYSTEGWRQTPRRNGAPPGRRNGGMGSQNVAAFCLSPLVRPNPKRRCDQKAAAEVAAFCKNRSRKMADFGRLQRRQ